MVEASVDTDTIIPPIQPGRVVQPIAVHAGVGRLVTFVVFTDPSRKGNPGNVILSVAAIAWNAGVDAWNTFSSLAEGHATTLALATSPV